MASRRVDGVALSQVLVVLCPVVCRVAVVPVAFKAVRPVLEIAVLHTDARLWLEI